MGIEGAGRKREHTDSASVVAKRLDVPGVASNLKIVNLGEELGYGTEGLVTRVVVTSSKAPDHELIFARKEFHHDESEVVPFVKLFTNYKLVKNAKLPVPPTFRAIGGKEEILITDLTDGGKNAVRSGGDISSNKAALLYEEKPELMHTFSHAEDVFSPRYKKVIADLMDSSAEAHLSLERDVWFAIINPEGSVTYTVGDFARVFTLQSSFPERDKDFLRQFNRNQFTKLWQKMKGLQLYGTDPEYAEQFFHV